MNSRTLLQAVAAAAILASGAMAHADPFGDSEIIYTQPVQVHSSRSFAEARAASLASDPSGRSFNYDGESYGKPVMAVAGKPLDRAEVRAAARSAKPMGEAGSANF